MTTDIAISQLQEKGWTLVQGVYDQSLMDAVKDEFYQFEDQFKTVQARKGLAEATENATHHTVVVCRKMLDLLEWTPVHDIVERFLDGKYILNTMGLSRIPPGGNVYTQNIHRDVRTFTGETNLWVNTLIMLDDSTPENGATLMLEGSQRDAKKPEPRDFAERAVVAEGCKGDVLVFDGNIWHSAGRNRTDKPRHIITPIYSRPFIKQQLDYPRAFGPDFGRTLSPHLRQVLGYNALTPVTLEEFYQQPEDRFYKSDQG